MLKKVRFCLVLVYLVKIIIKNKQLKLRKLYFLGSPKLIYKMDKEGKVTGLLIKYSKKKTSLLNVLNIC